MRFLIMNGAGNRFAVFDARNSNGFVLGEEKVKAICKVSLGYICGMKA